MAWKPILEGELQQEAISVAKQIADVVRTWKEDEKDGATLAGGESGKALMYAYLAQANLGSFEPAEELLARSIDAVAEQPMRPDLYGGFTGIAWAAEHLVGGPDAEEDSNEAIDEALIEHTTHTPWKADYDLIIGLVGFGVYALERAHRESARKLLAQVVTRLDEIAVPMDHGLSWLTSNELMIPETAAQNPEGYFNAGLAHGVPGIIALLGETSRLGIEKEKSDRLLTGAMDWMLSLRKTAPDGSEFPYTIPKHNPNEERSGCRAAWCYGDPGITAALLWAARSVGNAAWEQVAVEVGRQTAQRDPTKCGIVDAGICHGAAGLALIYNRMFQATHDPVFQTAAIDWTKRTLAMRKENEGIAGYLAWVPMGPDHKLGWAPDAGLLTGASGIALALAAAATDIEPKWDRMLLTTVPPK
jgi:hypothetical protein